MIRLNILCTIETYSLPLGVFYWRKIIIAKTDNNM